MGGRKDYMDNGDDSSDEELGELTLILLKTTLKRKCWGLMEDSQGGLGLGSSFKPAQQFQETPEASPKKEPVKEKVRARPNVATPPPGPGFGQFNAHSKGFGQKMLEKMGWKGRGLGADGEGIVNPVETKLRPARMGLSFRGFDERTDQAKVEAKIRKGEVSEEEEEAPKGRRRNAWKAKEKVDRGDTVSSRKPRKQKTVYKTAAEIIAEAEDIPLPPPSQQKVLDMTGPNIREISISDIKRTDSPTLMEVTTRLPELRHNLRLIVDLARNDLENLSREKQSTTFKMKSLEQELGSIKEKLDREAEQLQKIEKLKQIVGNLDRISKDALGTGAFENGNITAIFGEQFDILEREFESEVKTMDIDAIVISVWAPVWKYRFIHWNVLEEPNWGVIDVKRWKRLLTSNDDEDAERGWTSSRQQQKSNLICTPYETMMNTIWLSKVRSAINNQWDIHDPDPIIQLMEEWEPVLPRFIYENIIYQLILPKINRAVSDWNPRTDPIMIHSWIHPWFTTLKPWRLAELFTSIRHKLSIVLRQWHPSDESALHIISPWKNVWTPEQLENFTTKAIIPKLTLVLRNEFEVNPRDQKMEPFIWCLAWKDLISETVLGQLLQHEFFTKWHAVLQKWLLLDIEHINYDQISDWYRWWRQVFDSYGLDSNKVVRQELRKALDMMNKALGRDDLYSLGLSKK
ncbi:unnamed protein product [Mucor hiemalis]